MEGELFMMRFIVLAIVAFMPITAVLSQSVSVVELNNGECWAQQVSSTHWKAASFSSGEAFNFRKEVELGPNFLNELDARLSWINVSHMPASTYVVYISCDKDGMTVYMDVENIERSLCVELVMDGGRLASIGISEKDFIDAAGQCYGFYPSEFSFNVAGNVSEFIVNRIWSDERYRDIVKTVWRNEGDVEDRVMVAFKDAYVLRGRFVKSLLESDPEIGPFIHSFNHDTMGGPNSTVLKIMTGELPAF